MGKLTFHICFYSFYEFLLNTIRKLSVLCTGNAPFPHFLHQMTALKKAVLSKKPVIGKCFYQTARLISHEPAEKRFLAHIPEGAKGFPRGISGQQSSEKRLTTERSESAL
jgi:hypothetical protein